MKKILCLALLFSINLVKSQVTTQLKVTESPEFKDEISVDGVLAIHTTETGKTGLGRANKNNFLLDVFDAKLNKTFTK